VELRLCMKPEHSAPMVSSGCRGGNRKGADFLLDGL
jgi:hypothetical protein